MAILSITQKKSPLMPLLPHKLLIDGQAVGIMQGERVDVNLPEGSYKITIQSVFPFFSASRMAHIAEGVDNQLVFSDREKWWDILMVVDLVLWVADLFVTLPEKWELAYQIFTNGYLAVWIGYEWLIHKRYFRLEFFQTKKMEIATTKDETAENMP